jgi:hypothetical protein
MIHSVCFNLSSAFVGAEVLVVVVMKSSVFWDVTLCSPFKSADVSEELVTSLFKVK